MLGCITPETVGRLYCSISVFFNWTNTAIEQDVFGQIILDMDATKRLLIEMRKIRAEFPDVLNYISCDYKHNGQRSAMACNLCNPRGLRFL